MTEPIRLQSRVLAGEEQGPHLLITGGVHGDEFEPMVAIRRLARQVKPKSLRGTLTLVPVVNESAFRRKHRCGEDGLDLARTCPGRAGGSVTEQSALALSQLIRKADYFIDLHTGGTTLCVAPMVGYMLHDEDAVLDRQRQMARAFNLPIVWGTSAELDGRSLSVARDANVPAIYAEYLGSATCNPEGVRAYVDGCLSVMGLVGMIDRPPCASRVRHLVEDRRPQSGYMQIQNPAPMSGYFEPSVTVGQSIQAGDLLGIVCDALGEQRREVHSSESGIVLVLRTFPSVERGDGLAVILAPDKNGRCDFANGSPTEN